MASTTVQPPTTPPPAGSPPPNGGGKPGGVARAAGIVMALTLLSRLLGLVRDQVIAGQLGVGVQTDAYTAAFKVPDLLMYLVAGGALSSTFIPVFKEYLHLGKHRAAWQTFSVVATVTVVFATLFVTVAEIWTPWFVHILNAGYDAERIRLTVPLTRIVLPAQVFFLLGGLLMGTLNARGQFLIPALSSSIYNLGIIFGAAVLYPIIGLSGLMWGALGGAFIGNFVLQIIPVARLGMRYRPSMAILHPGAVKVWNLMLPVVLGVSLPNVDQIINGYFASELSRGSQSAMQFAIRLMLIPIGIFAQAMGIAILPTMSAQAAAGQRKEFRATANRALRIILFLTVPSSALLYLLAVPTVRLLFQHGHFSDEATQLTALPLRFYALGIFAWSAQAILTRAFYAMQDSRTPVISGTVMTGIFIGMNWLVVHELHWGVAGLALATSVAAALHMAVMYVFLRRRTNGLLDGRLLISAVKTVLATLALCLAAHAGQAAVLTFLEVSRPHGLTSKWGAALILAVAGSLGLVAFLGLARLLRMEELQSTRGMIKSAFGRIAGMIRRRRG